MRILAAWSALVILLCGILVPCPACERAVAEKAPVNEHACCERAEAGSPVDSGTQSAPDNQDCDRASLLALLAVQDREQPLTSLLAAHHALPDTLAALPLRVEEGGTSGFQPPGRTAQLDFFFSSNPQDAGSLILPLRL
jgi:hypothetical protein